MSRLTATMVVDITDRTGAKTQAIIGNLDRLKRAERDRMLAERGLSLNRMQRAQERELIARSQVSEEAQLAAAQRRAVIVGRIGAGLATAGAAAVYGTAKAYSSFAEVEDRIAGIVINADKGVETINPTMDRMRDIAQQTKQSFENITKGLDALVASGRSLEDAMAFLPAVALTAKASRADIADIALTADAVGNSFRVGGNEMQKAFDILVTGGKLGKFELKDMAQYLPSLAPSFAALGYEGTEGLTKLVAMLQTVRMQAGSSSEAATYLSNVFNKMYSSDVNKRFSDFGINLEKALDKARKSGADVLDVFIDLTELALKGDMTKITKLFGDAEMQKGVRALIMMREEQKKFNDELQRVDGAALKDFAAQAGLTANKLQELSNNWDRFTNSVGSGAATLINPVLDKINQTLDESSALSKAYDGMDAEQRGWLRDDFYGKYSKAHPDSGPDGFQKMERAFYDALLKVGRGETATVFDDLNKRIGAVEGGRITGQHPSRGTYDPDALARGGNYANLGRSTGEIPVPGSRHGPSVEDLMIAAERAQSYYPSRGSYDPDIVRREKRGRVRRAMAAGDDLSGLMDHIGGVEPAAVSAGRQSVSIEGTPTVTITNPPPRPNNVVHMNITINEASNPQAVAQQIGQNMRSQLDGLHSSTNDSGL